MGVEQLAQDFCHRAHDESVGREVAVSEGVRWGVVGVGRCQEVSGGFKIWGLGVRA